MSHSAWIRKHTHSLAGKTVAITGSTGGLGRALCHDLASLGASLILLDRNASRSQAHRDALLSAFPALSVRCLLLDLENMPSVRAVADELIASEVDIFIHNAGAYGVPRHMCDTGFENLFQINFLSPYYLIRRLLPSLQAHHGRVMVVSSIAHNYAVSNPAYLDFSSHPRASRAYGNAKRYLTFALHELWRTQQDVSLAITHPGITVTGITAHYPKAIYWLIKPLMRLIFMSPKKASLCLLAGLFDSCDYHEWIGPRFFHIWGLPKKQRLRTCSVEESCRIGETAETLFQSLS